MSAGFVAHAKSNFEFKPNIWADVPDMSVIRVGQTYYMSSTTMHLNPGVPIMKSHDLLHWQVINYAHQALDENNAALNLDRNNAYSKGTWASSINYKNGVFYVTSFSYTTDKTYIWTTTDIENGQWQQVTLDALYHDASLLLDDDGRAYLAYGHADIKIVELNSDLFGIKAGGLAKTLITDAAAIAGEDFILKAEGTQIQKINGWYYISNICWPRGKPRTQIIHRSRSLTGPYEGRLVFQDEGIAQGQYISTPDGKWYLYAFKDSGAVGRIPYLVPVEWRDGWPIISPRAEKLALPYGTNSVQGLIRSDDFNQAELDLVWQWNHNPIEGAWSLQQRPGYLRLTTDKVVTNLFEAPNTLTQRMFGPQSSATIKIELNGMENGDFTGLAALQDEYGLVGIEKHNDQHSVLMINNQNGDHQVIEQIALSQTYIWLRVVGDFTNQRDLAQFYYSQDGKHWQVIGNTLKMKYKLSHFMGYRFALFNYATERKGGYVDFDYFKLNDKVQITTGE
ncbi:glycoside hydrolase 43 family protein [Catenovulum sp. 2E275]|uniref:glycoside hydrolase family 43 protein n=1 Tax=Catenovulum sp. 2E275 TaxID=2980497 RepID=UPI0021CF9AD3|nr:glycoside hydrolase 43 family protein [Catenovulum sp. 2E275]MCU4674060.1 glycoside hydrolase 43 family protein [Catenovulum sp. 2E275]